MIPLVFILSVTAIKDGIEDYRRARLDEEVNTSAATKLGVWHNVNQPADPRAWYERLFGINRPGTVTKGVRRLREREAQDVRIVLERTRTNTGGNESSTTSGHQDWSHTRLEDIQSISSAGGDRNADGAYLGQAELGLRGRSSSVNSSHYPSSTLSHVSAGVVDWNRKPSGSNARWERTLWKKLEVGDIVLLRDNDQVPADIVVLSTSDSDGLCYVETKNLDGETNLKPRRSLRATSSIVSEEDIEHASFVLDSEPPHANLYTYNGVLRFNEPEGAERVEPVTINELLLRGCALRNSNWVIGLVVFTGADTKIMLNGGDTPSKRSKIEKETNFNVIMNFVILVVMCVTTAGVNSYYDVKSGTSARFFEAGSDPSKIPAVNALITFGCVTPAFCSQ
jgi:phospholipid-translocating ATPase